MTNPSTNIDVSIVIVNYNTFELTCNCIQSVLDKTKDLRYEVILVDNASHECDPEDFKTRFPSIVLIKSSENGGFAKGNNLGIEVSKGKYVLLLNSDTELINNSVKITFNYLEKHLNVGVVSAQLQYPDGVIQAVCQRFPSIKYQLIELLRLHKLVSKTKAGDMLLGAFFDHNQQAQVDWVWGAYFMFPKQILQQLPQKKLADNFFMYLEDMQWCFEISKLGYEVHYEPAAKVTHFMGGSGGKRNKLMEENFKIFMKMYYKNALHRKLIIGLGKLLMLSVKSS